MGPPSVTELTSDAFLLTLTVSCAVAFPLSFALAVITAVPMPAPYITPFVSTDTTEELLLLQVREVVVEVAGNTENAIASVSPRRSCVFPFSTIQVAGMSPTLTA